MSEISGRVVLFAHSRRANLGSGRDHRAKGKEVTDQEDSVQRSSSRPRYTLPLGAPRYCGQRTKLSPVSPHDLRTLIEMGLVEMRNEIPVLTHAGDRALAWPDRRPREMTPDENQAGAPLTQASAPRLRRF
jgi:hypothetical protein